MLDDKIATSNDYQNMIELWEESVSLTHQFLPVEYRQQLKASLPDYFPRLDSRCWYLAGDLVAISGTSAGTLALLFVHPNFFHQQIGSQILKRLIAEGISFVDVYEENPQALYFYQKHGFILESRDLLDSWGKAHPLLHLRYQNLDATSN